MNIEHAKTIHLSLILEKIGFLPQKETDNELWYISPFRNEKTASFHVNKPRNLWYDFGEARGGDNIKFVQEYLASTGENNTVSDALRWVNNMSGFVPSIQPVDVPQYNNEDKGLVLKDAKPIRHIALVEYLKSRGIPIEIGKLYLQEVSVYNSEKKKTYFALGFKNEESGYELRNPYFKGCIRPKDVTFIRGTVSKPDGIHIFEGFMDYLSIICQRDGKQLDDDVIVLNSLACLHSATAYIKGYGYHVAYTWLDNDTAGQKATASLSGFFKTEDNLQHKPMNNRYAPHKDVNAWHMYKLGLVL
jgi:hypothetical protein